MVYGYLGGYPSLDPNSPANYGEVSRGYSMPVSRLGSTTSVQTAMQVAEVEARLKEGMSTVEMGVLSADLFDRIPKQHFDEIRQLAKISGADITMHAPLIDPSGIKEGRWLGEQARQEAERHLTDIAKKAMIVRPEGGIPITIHGAGPDVQAREWAIVKDADGKEMKKPQVVQMTVVKQDTGEMTVLKREEEWFPSLKEMEIKTPENKLKTINETEWHNSLVKAQDMTKEADNWIEKAENNVSGRQVYYELQEKKLTKDDLQPNERIAVDKYEKYMHRASIYNKEAEMRIREVYDKAKKYSKDKNALLILENVHKTWVNSEKKAPKEPLLRTSTENKLFSNTIQRLEQLGSKYRDEEGNIKGIDAPKLFIPVEEFAKEKAAKTLSNVALNVSFNKDDKTFKSKVPIITIENFWPNAAFSSAKELKGLIKETRKQFIKTAVKKGADENEAERTAKKMIGATWDIAHINLMRKHGFTEKDVMKETERIKKFIKHVHVGDNFGHYDTDLPVGMGTVPIKKFMKMLHEQGYKGKAILESGGFAANFKGASPQSYSLEGLDSPIYSEGGGPTWGQGVTYAQNFSGYGLIFPEQHFAMYGGGFSQLPTELGGKMPSKGSGFSGTPIE